MAIQETIKEKFLIWQLESNKKVFVKAYDLYLDDVYRFIYFKINNPEEARDLTSEVFLKTWNYIQEKGLNAKTLRPLIYRIARNLIIDYYRKKSSQDVSLEGASGQDIDVIDDRQNVAEIAQISLAIEDIKEKIMNLKDEYREVIILHFINELSISEIAEIINKTKGNTRVLIHRALRKLKEMTDNID